MTQIFNIGDVVQIDINKITLIQDKIPTWYSAEIYAIVKLLPDNRVLLNKNLPGSNFKDDTIWSKSISTYYLKIALKEERKLKLQKIYENTNEY